MRSPDPLPTREQAALAEMAASRISMAGAAVASTLFLLLLLIGVGRELQSLARGGSFLAARESLPTAAVLLQSLRSEGALAANRVLRLGLAALEDRTGRDSALSRYLRPRAQRLLAERLGYGNTQVLVGGSGRLYFSNAFDYVTGRAFLDPRQLERRREGQTRFPSEHPDPVPALLALRDELAEQEIQLVFFPIPVKSQIEPEGLARRDFTAESAPENPSYRELLARLAAGGLPVFDALEELRAARRAGEEVYLANDTHWSPRGVEVAATALAEFLTGQIGLPRAAPAGLTRRPAPFDFQGDLERLLGLGDLPTRFQRERVEVQQVLNADGTPFEASLAAADILLLGDSYSIVYTTAPGLAGGAGLVEQLAFHLDRPVRRLAKLGANALEDRIGWLRMDRSILEGKRLVIYEVTARAFATVDWKESTLRRLKRRHS